MKLESRSSFGWPTTAASTAPCRNGLVIHYDGAPKPNRFDAKPHSACRDYWQRVRRDHMDKSDPKHGWLDIGYSYGVCAHGIVFEGRGFGRQQAAQPGGNSTWTSATLMLGDGEAPTKMQLEATRELRAYLRGKGLAAAVRGHRDFVSTSCPGSALYALVKDGAFTRGPSATTPASSTKPPPFPGRVLIAREPEMHGEDVRTWQIQMRKRGWILVADGFYGPSSAAICRAFQHEKALTADGKVGSKTWVASFAAPVT